MSRSSSVISQQHTLQNFPLLENSDIESCRLITALRSHDLGAGHLRLCDAPTAQAAPTCFESCSFETLPLWTASPLRYSKARCPHAFFSWLRSLLAPLNLVTLYDSCCRSSCDYPQTGTSEKKKRMRSKKSFSSSSIPLRSPPCLWTDGWLCARRYAIYQEQKPGEQAAERLEC